MTNPEQLFRTILNQEKTEIESLDGFKSLNYTQLSENKVTRLSEISHKITPYPFIVEILTNTNPGRHYKAEVFDSLSHAESFQDSL